MVKRKTRDKICIEKNTGQKWQRENHGIKWEREKHWSKMVRRKTRNKNGKDGREKNTRKK